MEIEERNQDIISRHVGRESFASIGRDHGLSRERVRQIFDQCATEEQWSAAQPVKLKSHEPAIPAKPHLPKGELRHRMHITLSAPIQLTQEEIRAAIAAWVKSGGKLPPKSGRGRYRVNVIITASMREKLETRCAKDGIGVNGAVRAIIERLEKSKH